LIEETATCRPRAHFSRIRRVKHAVSDDVANNGLHGMEPTSSNCSSAGRRVTDLDGRIIQFSTEEIPEQDRVASWREHYGRIMLRADIEPARDAPFSTRNRWLSLPDLRLLDGASSPVTISRRRQHLADGNDDVVVAVNRTGMVAIESGGREQTLREGEAIVLSGAEPFTFNRTSFGRSFSFRVPRRTFETTDLSIDEALMRPIAQDRSALKLLTNYADWLLRSDAGLDRHLLGLSVRHLKDLLALAIDDAPALPETTKIRGLRAARLKLAKSHIISHSERRDVTIGSVAANLHVTPRYLQRLFEADGTTFSEFLIRQRLARAHQLLCDPNFQQLAISSIAYDVGFGDLSYFNRRFRRQYGLTPGEVRHEKG
jgi:AraC-like DNA-binding protein